MRCIAKIGQHALCISTGQKQHRVGSEPLIAHHQWDEGQSRLDTIIQRHRLQSAVGQLRTIEYNEIYTAVANNAASRESEYCFADTRAGESAIYASTVKK